MGEDTVESCEECQRLRKILPLKEFNHLFENERYTGEMTKGHLCTMKIREEGERVHEETSRGFCLFSSKNVNKSGKLGNEGGRVPGNLKRSVQNLYVDMTFPRSPGIIIIIASTLNGYLLLSLLLLERVTS